MNKLSEESTAINHHIIITGSKTETGKIFLLRPQPVLRSKSIFIFILNLTTIDIVNDKSLSETSFSDTFNIS